MFDIRQRLSKVLSQSDTQTSPDADSDSATEQTPGLDKSSEPTLSRPPGWEPLYGSYEKPVYPIEDTKVEETLSGLVAGADMADFKTEIPAVGTNMEHIRLQMYTVTDPDGGRTLVIDVCIDSFSDGRRKRKRIGRIRRIN